MIVKFVGLVVKGVLVFVLLIAGLGYLVSGGSRPKSPELVVSAPSEIIPASMPLEPVLPVVQNSELEQPKESLPKALTSANVHQVASLFDSAINLERMGKVSGAIDTYSRIYMRFYGTTGATRAVEEIHRLGGKVPDDSQVKEFQERERGREIRDKAAAEVHAQEKARQEQLRIQRAAAIAEAAARAYISSSSSGDHVGPRGGVYHYSKNGNKVYSRKH
jgi:hypothetical protein